MKRRLSVAVGACVFFLVLAIQAQPPLPDSSNKPKSDANREDVVRRQDKLLREYKQFEGILLRMAQRLEKSTNPDDKGKAEALRKAINLSNKEGVENKFQKLITTLVSSKTLTVDDLQKATEQNVELIKVLREMLDLLLTDSEVLKRREEIARLTEILKQVESIIRAEKITQARIEGNKVDEKTIGKEQNKITKNAESVARTIGAKPKKGDPKKGDPKSGDPKKGDPKKGDPKKGDPKKGDPKKGDPKSGDPKKGDPKSGDPKSGDPKKGDPKSGDPKSGDPKKGDPKSGDPKSGENQPQNPQSEKAKKQIQEAIENMKKAEEDLEKKKREPAAEDVNEAIKKLEELKKELERLLKQLREEELERLLANLQSRCERMLAMQTAVYQGTQRVYGVIQTYPDKKPTRAEEQRSQKLSTDEGDIVKLANSTLQLLEAEGTAVAFAGVLESVRDDMANVEKRLDKYDVSPFTQRIEEDIIAQLKDMIDALKKAQQDMKDKKNNPPKPNDGPPPPQRLLDLLAELKLIRSMQMQVNKRTKDYSATYQGEQADEPQVQGEIQQLSKRQVKIEGMTKNIASGKNR